jgi:hypothetical protein
MKYNSTEFWATIAFSLRIFWMVESVLGIIDDKLRGPRSLLKLMTPITISLTNYHIKTSLEKRTNAMISHGRWTTRNLMTIAELADSGWAS